MYRYLGNMEIKEFDDFLKFFKKRANEDFEVVGSAMDILKDGEKVSIIWILVNSAGGGFRRGDIVFEIRNPKKRNISLYEKIEKTKKVYNELKEEFKQTGVYEKHKLKKEMKKQKEREKKEKRIFKLKQRLGRK